MRLGAVAVTAETVAVVVLFLLSLGPQAPRFNAAHPVVGSRATVKPGYWINSPQAFHYLWGWCGRGGCTGINAKNSRSSSYTISQTVVGYRLAVKVTACNSHGCTSAQSSRTGIVRRAK